MTFGLTENMWHVMSFLYLLNSSILISYMMINKDIGELLKRIQINKYIMMPIMSFVIMYGIALVGIGSMTGWIYTILISGIGIIIVVLYVYGRITDKIREKTDKYVIILFISSIIQMGYSYYVLYVLKTYTI